jgi:hypothetical protein
MGIVDFKVYIDAGACLEPSIRYKYKKAVADA